MNFDDRVRRRAQMLLGRRSKTATYRVQTSSGGPSPVITNTDTSIQVRMASWPVQKIDGTLIRATDLRLLIPATFFSIPPKPGDRILIDNQDMAVVFANPTYAASEVSVWEVNARS